MKRVVDWERFDVRTCKTVHSCCICGKDISYGETYVDGGYGSRGHVTCVDGVKVKR